MTNKVPFLLSLLVISTPCLRGGPAMEKSSVKRAIQTKEAPSPIGPFSQAVEAGGMLFISGMLPMHPETGELESDPKKATEQCMRNLLAVLKEAGLNFNHVTKTTILLADIADFPVVNKAYESFLQPPYPARATFQAAALPKGARVEIEMIAVR